MLACCGGAAANPVGPSVAAGAAAFQANGKTLTVSNAPGTIINWQAFSIGMGELTRFNQQSASSAVLNRVVGNDGSKILGTLSSNGRVFLVNPHGIVFGAGSRIDTAGFIASTLNIADKDFLSGKLKFEGGGHGILRNEGTIRAASDIVLVGPQVENAGLIRSDSGAVLLAAGRSVTITSPNAQGVKFEVQAPTDSALNLGTIEAADAATMLAGTLRHSGDIRATGASVEGARVVLSAQKEAVVDAGSTITTNGTQGGDVTIQSGDLTSVAGRVEATGSAGPGGTVQILGNRVALSNGARIDASGATGGGTILVGGDYHGKSPDVQNAWRTFVGPDTELRADAVASGDGGKVIVWADDTARFYGSISARGGARSGDGGFVETSGKESLSVAGARVDTTAPAGRTGTWLLDPKFIVVLVAGPAMPETVDQFGDNPSGAETIDPGMINGAASNVVLQANTDITFSSPIDMSGAGVGLTAQAGRSIMVNANISTNNGNITLVANETTPGVIAADRDDGAAVLSMATGTTINAGNGDVRLRIASGAGRVAAKMASGDITLANVFGNNISVAHEGPTANSSILRDPVASLLTAATSVHLVHTPNGAGASIGTDPLPIAIATPSLEAHMTGGAGGIFIDSPNAGNLQIGGVPNTVFFGFARGVQAMAGGPIRLTVNGNLTRFAGPVGCGATGAAGGAICSIGNGPGAEITLNALALGAPGPDGRLHVDAQLGGSVSATSTVGGIFLERRAGNLDVDRYAINAPAGTPLELATGNGILNVNASIAGAGGSVTLVSAGGPIAFADGVTVTTPALTLGGGPAVFDAGMVTLNAPVVGNSPLSIGGATVNFNGAVATESTLGISGGRANFGVDSTFAGAVTLSGGALAGPGIVTASNGLNFSGNGTIASGGNVLVFPGGTTTITTGTPRITGTLNAGQLNMTGGTLAIDASGTLTIPGVNASTISAATINNAGTVNLAGPGDLNLDSGATFNNNSGALFDIQTNAGIRHTTGAVPAFANSGELRKSGGGVSGVSIVGNPINFTNAAGATINVQSGTLQVSNGLATNDGTININVDTTFSTNGAALTNSNTGTIQGSGTLDLGGATLTNNGVLDPGLSAIGTLNITGNLTQGATGRVNVGLTGTDPSQMDRVAVTGLATLGGILNVAHEDGFNPPSDSSYTILTFGSRSGDFATKNFPAGYEPQYGTTLNATDYRLNLGAVVNTWTGAVDLLWQTPGNWSLGHAPNSGEDAFIGNIAGPGPADVTVTVTAGDQSARGLTMAENVASGAGGLLSLGPVNLLNGATLTANEGTLVLNGAVTGVGTLLLSGPMGFLDARTALTRLVMLGGTLTRTNAGNVTITGPFTVSGGVVSLSGELVTSGTTTVSGTFTPNVNWRNSGTVNLAGGQVSPTFGLGFVFTNEPTGIVNVTTGNANPFANVADASISNAGAFNKNPGSVGTQTINAAFTNSATGTLNVNAGTLVMPAISSQAGTVNIAGGATLSTDGNALVNTGTIARTGPGSASATANLGSSTLTNNGTLRPGIGTLAITGNLTQGATGVINAGLAGPPAGQSSVVTVSGTANLGGSTLNLTAVGGYVPASGDSFTPVEAAVRTGTFGTVTPTNFTGPLTESYAPASASVSVDAPPLNFWLPNADGNWNVGANWSLGVVPDATHLAKIERPAAITVTVPAGAFGTDRLRSEENLTIAAGGTLGLANASRINATLAVNGGTLQGAGAVTVNGPFSLDAATIASPVTVNGTTGVSGGASQVNGSLTTSGLNITSGSLTIGAGGVLGLTGALAKTIGAATVTNNGTINFGGTSSLALNAGSTLTNNATINLNATATDTGITGAGVFQNNAGGTVNSTAAGINRVVASTFNNAGTVNVDGGTLRLTGGGTDTGAYIVDAATTLNFGGGTRNLNAGSNVTGPGAVNVSGGTVNVNGNYGIATTGTTSVTGGEALRFNVDVTFANAFTLTGGESVALAGTGNIVMNGDFNWSGDTDTRGTGTLTTNGNVIVTGPAIPGIGHGIGKPWTNNGMVTFANGGLVKFTSGGSWTNSATGVINLDNGGAEPVGYFNGPVPTFLNQGRIVKSAAGVQNFNGTMIFNNTGAGAGRGVHVTGGTLRIDGGGTDTGDYAVSAGATLQFSGGTRNLNAGSNVTGAGTALVSGGTLNVNAAYSPTTTSISAGTANFNGALPHTTGTLNLTGGTLSGTGNLTVTTGGTWSGGTLSGAAASLSVAGGAVFNLTGAGAKVVGAATLNNNAGGTVNLTGAGNLVLNNGATANNAGLFDIQSDADVLNTAGGATLANTGTLRKSAGAGTSALGSNAAFTLNNAVAGTIDVQSGTLLVAGSFPTNSGTINVAPATTFSTSGQALTNAGTLRGAGIVNVGAATLTNNNIIAPGTGADTTGALAVTGSLTQGAAGRLDIELGGTAAGAFDTLTVSGTAALDGTLALSTTGGYAPAVGDPFPVLTAGTRTGNFATTTKTFANEVLPTYAAGGLTLTLGSTTANTWIFDVSDTWTSAQRWSQGRAPIATDTVTIDRPAGVFTVTVPAGAFSAAALTSTENVTIAGTLDLAGASIVTGTLAVNGGRLQGAGPVTVNGTLALDAGTIASPGGVTVNGSLGVSGGASTLVAPLLTANGLAMTSGSLAVAAGSTLGLAGGLAKAIGGGATLTNSGRLNLGGTANLALNAGGSLTNNAGATLDIQSNINIERTVAAGAASTLINAGTIMKSGGAGTSTIGGALPLASVSNGGTYDATAGNTLTHAAVNTFNNGTRFIGAGMNVVTTDSTFNGTITANGLTLQSGVFGGNASFAGTTAWTGGIMSGTFTVPAGATLDLTGAGAKTVNGAAASLTTNGTVNVSGTGDTTLSGGALWDNFGALNLGGAARIVLGGDGAATLVNRGTGVITDTSTNAAPITTAGATKTNKAFSNAGTFNKNAGSAATQTIDVPMTNTGMINVRSGTLVTSGFPTNNGIIDLEAGTTLSSGGAAFTNSPIGSITGNGTIAATPFTNNGSLGPGDSPGTLTIAGNFVQGPTGTLVVELGGTAAGATYDVLNVTGNATLDGALALLVTPGQAIIQGNTFDFMTYGSRTGDFTTFVIPAGQMFQLAPGPASYRVTAGTTTLPPAQATEINRIGQKDVLVFAERRPDNVLVPDQQQQQSDEKRKSLGECR